MTPQQVCRKIGAIFTPDELCETLLIRFGVVEAFLNGGHILDPTAGDGAFLRALIRLAQKKRRLSASDLSRLHGVEKDARHLKTFAQKLKAEFQLNLSSLRIYHEDIFDWKPSQKFDVILGNPPWVNFADLPEDYKPQMKEVFTRLGLIADRQSLLLGSSRMDIASAVFAQSMQWLTPQGIGVLICPLSLFLNDGAHDGFRHYISQRIRIEYLSDLTESAVFDKVSTRYGVCFFKAGAKTQFPIPFFQQKDIHEEGTALIAEPIGPESGPWLVRAAHQEKKTLPQFSHSEKPRQGVNTCGANDILIVQIPKWDKGASEQRVFTKNGQSLKLPSQFLFPLMTKEIFEEGVKTPVKFVILPHDRKTGKPLAWEAIAPLTSLVRYLKANQKSLENRKGTLINTWIRRGFWWALLGVGPYSFGRYKVAWEAFGSKSMQAGLFKSFEGQEWQGNQALHAFVSASNETQALSIAKFLNSEVVQEHLASHLAIGSKNWAQPGKVSKLFNVTG